MKKSITTTIVALLVAAASALCWAGEKTDHICFRVLDADKDGYVTIQEFKRYFENDDRLFGEADADKDGKLTHQEYHGILGHGS